ncbi:MAG: hypothetical protein EXR45_08705 [Chloroflexi bacterium]|nr:hypothetical protein [Chloroflexota bacterium]
MAEAFTRLPHVVRVAPPVTSVSHPLEPSTNGGSLEAPLETSSSGAATGWRRRVPSTLAIAIIGVFTAVLLRVPLGGQAMMSYDLFVYFFPAKTFLRNALSRGELPLWNPDTFFGAPFLANIQMAVLYPPDIIFLVAPFTRAVAASQAVHLFLAGVGFFLLARRGWGLGHIGALAGSLIFAGSGFIGAHMGHLNQVHAATWIPWLVLTVHGTAHHFGRLLRPTTTEPAPRGWNRFGEVSLWVSGGAVVIALLFTAGHTQETYYALLTIGAEAAIFTIAPPTRIPVRGSHLLSVGVITSLGMLLAGAQLVPTLELTHYGYRGGGMSLDEAGSYAIDRTHILEALLPTYWNLPAQEVTGYTGIVALPFAFAALGAARARRQMFALGAIALGALILGVGVYTPVFDALHRFAPMFASFRAPGRWLLIWTFSVAGLASHGLDALRARRIGKTTRQLLANATDQSARIASVTAVACVVIGLVILRTYLVGGVQWLPPGRVALTWFWFGATTIALVSFLAQARGTVHALGRCAAVGLISGELLLAGHRMEYALGGDPGLYTNPPPVTAHAIRTLSSRAPDASPGRLVSLTVEQHLDTTRLARWAGSTDGETVRYRAMQDALKPNLGAVYGLATIDGYDGGLLPLRSYARFKALLLPQGAEPSVAHLTLGAQASGKATASRYASLGIGAVISDGRNGSPGDNWRTNDEAPGAAWWHDNNLPPASRALLVGNVIVEPDDDRAITLLAFADLSNTAIIQRAIQGVPERRSAPTSAPVGTAKVTRYLANEITVDTSSDRTALLVMTETDYPGWHATIDGQLAPIIRANGLFRSVVVPPGTHVIRFWFAPTSIIVGFGITFLTFFALTTTTCVTNWRRFGGRASVAPHSVNGDNE